MGNLRRVRLSEDERDELPMRGGSDALSFSTDPDESPPLLPVWYGHDAATTSIYFRLAFPSDSEKAAGVDGPLAFSTYVETGDRRRSVGATSRLEAVTDRPYASSAAQGVWTERIPEVDTFDRPPEEIPFGRFRLRPGTPTGRKAVRAD